MEFKAYQHLSPVRSHLLTEYIDLFFESHRIGLNKSTRGAQDGYLCITCTETRLIVSNLLLKRCEVAHFRKPS